MKHLKLFFALFAMLALGVTNAWGETVTFTPSNCTNWTGSQAEQTQTIDGITLHSTGAANNTQLRLYSGATHTFTSTVGNITSILFTCTANGTNNYGPGKMAGDGYVAGTGKTGEWTGNSAEVTLTGGQSRCTSIVVTYTPSSGGTEPPTPTTQYTIKWHTAKGVTTDVTLAEGATITKPATDPTMTGYEFMGWTEDCAVASDGDGFTAITDFGTADSDKDFYAVFAKATTSGGGGTTTETLKGSDVSYSGTSGYVNFTATTSSGTWSGKGNYNTKGYIQINKNSNNYHIGSPTFASNVTSIKITTTNNSAANRTFYICSSNSTAQPSSGNLGSHKTTITNESFTIDLTTDAKQFYIYSSGAVYISQIDVTFVGGTTTYSDYITTCASDIEFVELGDDFKWSAAEAEVTIDATDNVFPTLTNTHNVPVTYSSTDDAFASIAADGTVTLKKEGTVTITAKYEGGISAGTGKEYKAKEVTYSLKVNKAAPVASGTTYVKVTSTAGITDGEYLIVYEDAASETPAPVAFDGSLATLDAVSNTIEVEITDGTIAGTNYIDAATFTIDVTKDEEATTGTIKSASGLYIGKTANSNGLDAKDTEMTNTLAVDVEGNAVITGNVAALRYNNSSDQTRFRYYKDGGGSQAKIALYKKASKHTVTLADCTNGSVSAKMGETALATNDQVLSGIQITLNNTPAENYKLAAYDVYKTDDATTKVTVTDGKFIMPEFDVTISATFELAKTLTGIEITTPATQTTFWQTETFNHDGLKVIAHFEGAADEDVTDKVTVTGSTATAGAAVEVTVSYNEGATTKTATYNITVKDIPNTKETAYTVADAYDIIDKLTTAEGVFIKGIVSQVDEYLSSYKSITYWISDDGTATKQLQVYSGKGLEGAEFDDINGVSVEDQVIVCGDLKKHTDGTYEFNYDNYLVEHIKTTKADPELSYTPTEYNINLGDAFTAPTLNNPHSLAVTYSSNDEDVATVAVDGAVTIKAAGTVTITASFAGDDDYIAKEASYTINITDPNLLEVTFDATQDLDANNIERGEGSIAKSPITFACSDGILGNGSEYRIYTNADATFSAAEGYIITKVVLTSTAAENADRGPGHLSTNEGTYTYSGKVGTWVGEAYTVTLSASEQVRATTITVYYKQDNRVAAGLAWNPETVTLTVGDAFTAPTFSNPNSVTGIEFTSSNSELATVNNAGVISLVSGKTGTATITATFAGDATYKAAEVTCTITVDHKSEDIVILAKCKDQYYALVAEYVEGKTDVLQALPVEYVGGKIYNVETEDQASIIWKRSVVDGKTTFKNGENYLSAVNSAALQLATEACEWVFEGDMYKVEEGSTRTILYYTSTGGFKNYSTSNMSNDGVNGEYSSAAITVAPVFADGDAYHRTVSSGNYGTICIPYGSSNYKGAEFYEVAWVKMNEESMPTTLYLDQLEAGATLEAGKPYIFKATATEIAIIGDGTSVATPIAGINGLKGTFENITAGGLLVDNYIIAQNQFWTATAENYLNAYRAYIVPSSIPTTEPAEIPGRRRIAMGAAGENEATGLDNITTTDTPVKVIVNGQLIIIREGVKYNVQGQKL